MKKFTNLHKRKVFFCSIKKSTIPGTLVYKKILLNCVPEIVSRFKERQTIKCLDRISSNEFLGENFIPKYNLFYLST